MFHLPREIIQLIFEFDPTYSDEYSKILKILDELPTYNGYKKTHDLPPDIYWFHTYIVCPLELGFVTSCHPPNKYYFQISNIFLLVFFVLNACVLLMQLRGCARCAHP